jgi:DNA-binding NarL/FixJ family response regulator
VLIVEDDGATRDHLAAVVAASPGFALAGAAADLAQARRLLAAAVDVLLTDLGLPDGSGIALIREARAQRPALPIMVMTVLADEQTVLSAIEAGANSYLIKGAGRDEVSAALEQLLAGGSPISPSIARHLLRRLQGPPPSPAAAAGASLLSERETEILRHIAKGFSSAEVARLLEISVHTVTTHVRNLYRKLEVTSRTSAIYEAVSLGIIRLDD